MIVRLDLDPKVLREPRAMATVARGYLHGLVLYDRVLLRKKIVPPIYDAFMNGDIEFRSEPWAGKYEEFADALTCIRRGWGDCDDLAPWRVAELNEQGERAGLKIYWRGRGFHVEVRRADGTVEDVARFLGMRGKV